MERQRIAVVGAGLIGQRHVIHVSAAAHLHAIVDPTDNARQLALDRSVPWFPSVDALLKDAPPDGMVIATPTPMHFDNTMTCIAAGIPALIEKPITSTVNEGRELVAAAAGRNVPLLVGHHRRYNPILQQAKRLIDSGRLGNLVSVNAMCWLYKPDNYFDAAWRRKKGAGPVLTNLIHDVDLMRFLCGDITFVQAAQSNRQRGFDNEDSAAILLGFASGVLGTMTLSDTVVSPWSWELTAGENRAYPHTNQSAYMIGGTRGSLSLPDLGLWHNGDSPGWWEPISRETTAVAAADPLLIQIEHFCDVITGSTQPLVSGSEGLATLQVIDAIRLASETERRIEIKPGNT